MKRQSFFNIASSTTYLDYTISDPIPRLSDILLNIIKEVKAILSSLPHIRIKPLILSNALEGIEMEVM